MELWFVIITTACIAAVLKALVSLYLSKSKAKIPPGPRGFPIISRIQWIGIRATDLEAALRKLYAKFGPIVTLPIARYPIIFISSRSLAHQALVHYGAIFADRPKPLLTAKIITSNQHNISSASYGPNWRLFRRNLTSQILHPSRVKDFCHARKWTLDILLNHLSSSGGAAVKVIDDFRFAMFCLLVFMCFGDKLDESQVKEIEVIQHQLLTSFNHFAILNFWPRLTRVLLRGRWNALLGMMKKQKEVLIPKIRSRKHLQEEAKIPDDQNNSRLVSMVTCYVDSLLTIEIPEGESKRKLTEEQLVSLCSEFLNAGTDTTSTALQWIMANLVKYPEIQAKLFEEIRGVVAKGAEVEEDDLAKMPYLKAVVLEGLRRHPPGHFLLPHSVTDEVELGGYTIPQNAIINFMVADINLDPEVWEDPMQFKPERFLSEEGSCEEFDITGSREIKMMPFGAGRRMCPGLSLAMLHLEYFVANLVWNFEWKTANGDEVDLSEKQEFTTVMKHPLNVHISPRPK